MHFIKYILIIMVLGISHQAYSQTQLQFLSKAEAIAKLASEDPFVDRLSEFDMSARMKSEQKVSKSAYLSFVSKSALDWQDAQRDMVSQVFNSLTPRFAQLQVALPKKIQMVLTDGNEEGGAAYTRDNAIFLQPSKLTSEDDLKRLLIHEIFHVYSRHNPAIRKALYQQIGFYSIPELVFPAPFKNRKLTNPDAPINESAIKLTHAGSEVWAIPILYSYTDSYSSVKGGEFFEYMQFKFLLLKDSKGNSIYNIEKPTVVDLPELEGFFAQVGENTNYIIHPEEILADNFALLVLEKDDVKSPEILDKIRSTLLAQ